LRYNEDDCRATLILKDWLHHFLAAELAVLDANA
jgi:predicted RecB family nuclease